MCAKQKQKRDEKIIIIIRRRKNTHTHRLSEANSECAVYHRKVSLGVIEKAACMLQCAFVMVVVRAAAAAAL